MIRRLREVHEAHCCLKHGCKYGDKDCVVAAGAAAQRYPCEECQYEKESIELLVGKKISESELVAQVGSYTGIPRHLAKLLLSKYDIYPKREELA